MRKLATFCALLLAVGAGGLAAQETQQPITSHAQLQAGNAAHSRARHRRHHRAGTAGQQLAPAYSPQWGGDKSPQLRTNMDMASPKLRAGTSVDVASPQLRGERRSQHQLRHTPPPGSRRPTGSSVKPDIGLGDGSVRYVKPGLASGRGVKASARPIRRDPPDHRPNGTHPRHRGSPGPWPGPCPPNQPPTLGCLPQRPLPVQPGAVGGTGAGLDSMKAPPPQR